MSGCEETLVIPRELTDESGDTKKVEVIGRLAYYACGDRITRSIVLSRYIKVIKYEGLGEMDDVKSFRIEEGSYLESIDSYGLSYMSCENKNEDARRSILVLSSIVTSIAEHGLHCNNLITVVQHISSTLVVSLMESMHDIKVTSFVHL